MQTLDNFSDLELCLVCHGHLFLLQSQSGWYWSFKFHSAFQSGLAFSYRRYKTNAQFGSGVKIEEITTSDAGDNGSAKDEPSDVELYLLYGLDGHFYICNWSIFICQTEI